LNNQRAAVHYAAQFNQAVYQFLVSKENGGNANLMAGAESAEDIFKKYFRSAIISQKLSCSQELQFFSYSLLIKNIFKQ
jgi:hypothetical protein